MALPSRPTIETYDGQNKINGPIYPANQTRDWNNPLLAACTSDVSAMAQTAPRFWARMTLATSTGGLVLNSWQSNWIIATPTLPVLSRTATGIFTIAVPGVVSDEYDASVGIENNITVNLSAARAGLEGTAFGFCNASASGNIITINLANTSGSANDLAGSVLFVIAY